MEILGYFECFQCFNCETSFLKNEKKNSKNMEHHTLIESTSIESATFRYKTDLPKANVKAK